MRVAEAYTVFAFCTWFLAGARGVHGHISRATAKSSSSASTRKNPGFNFSPISEMTNCNPATFTRFYGATTDSQPVDLTFVITSDVPGDSHLD
ncbi:hypothetical protein DFH09DRAFT_1149183 [Mycena vulgaris]|nr:hypothetical protein DFH09DRAFT_1149183 [Mycena vulgaris]